MSRAKLVAGARFSEALVPGRVGVPPGTPSFQSGFVANRAPRRHTHSRLHLLPTFRGSRGTPSPAGGTPTLPRNDFAQGERRVLLLDVMPAEHDGRGLPHPKAPAMISKLSPPNGS
jgi:hypothetical protein